jgi:ribosome maturation protein Sdo1
MGEKTSSKRIESSQTKYRIIYHISRGGVEVESSTDSSARMLFDALVKVLEHSGLNHAQVMEALKGLVNNWWIDSSMHVMQSLMGVLS